ncbi:MAG: ATP synthase F1 subunit delta [Planctomycetaceae bacterium]|nr:ATP synthase F1 subunit delta [Planctomycetaceae bacterium]
MTQFDEQADHRHDTVFDVDLERLAGIYAAAALDAAGDPAAQGGLVEELVSLRDDVLRNHPDLEELFRSELVSQDEKLAMIDRVFGGRASATLVNVLKVMAHHGRLGIVRHVAQSAMQLWQERSGRKQVVLETAEPIDATVEGEILGTLRGLLGAEPDVTRRVNPELLAGFVVRVGDRVYDASARTRLERTRQNMIERAAEAIHLDPNAFVVN